MRFPDCVAVRRPLPAAIAWPDAMSGHFFCLAQAPPHTSSGRRAATTGITAPSSRHHFMPKRPRPFMPPMARIIFAMPPFFICFIMPCICSN